MFHVSSLFIGVFTSIILTWSTACFAAVYTIDPTIPNTKNTFQSPAQVPWAALKPGDRVLVKSGIYKDIVVIPSIGTQTQPIVVRAAAGHTPVFEHSILLEGAKYVVLDGLTIRKTVYPGIIIRNGAANDTVRNSMIHDSAMGIWIGEGAGGGHNISNNTIHSHKTFAIGIDRVNATGETRTIIRANTIYKNGSHGIEINGNYYTVAYNTLWDNGLTVSGSSGIHTYAKNAAENTGKYNVIAFNTVYNTHESGGQDGNGIQLDQWCDFNRVYGNISFNNDGAGIVLFDAADNSVFNNTLFGNGRDPSKTHAYRGDLVLAANENVNRTERNVLSRNVLNNPTAGAYSLVVDKATTLKDNQFDGQIFKSSGNLYYWGGTIGKDISALNQLKKGTADIHLEI